VLKLQVILAFALTAPSFAQQPSTPEQLLDAVDKKVDLSASGPYSLTATVVSNPDNPKKQQSGQLRIDRDHDRFRVELSMPGYQEVRLALGDKRYLPKGQGTLFVTGLANFDRSWNPLREDLIPQSEKATYGNVSQKKIGGRGALCFDKTRGVAKASAKTRYCIDPERSVVLRRDAGRSRMEFSDYAPAGAAMAPRKVTIQKPSITNLEVRDISVSYQSPDPARFAVPEQSIEIETCKDEQQPKPVSTPEPSYSEEARSKHHEASLVLHALIAADGSVLDAQVLNPTGDGLDISARDTVRRWTFKPATCAGRPVMAEMMVEVEFRLR
jgi:TonB family protein